MCRGAKKTVNRRVFFGSVKESTCANRPGARLEKCIFQRLGNLWALDNATTDPLVPRQSCAPLRSFSLSIRNPSSLAAPRGFFHRATRRFNYFWLRVCVSASHNTGVMCHVSQFSICREIGMAELRTITQIDRNFDCWIMVRNIEYFYT